MVRSSSFEVCTCSVLFEDHKRLIILSPVDLSHIQAVTGNVSFCCTANNAVLTLSKQVVMSVEFKSPTCYINDVVEEFLQLSVLENSTHHMYAT